MSQGLITDREKMINFIFAGRSTFTIVSTKTKARFTYKVLGSITHRWRRVLVLRGPDNTREYTFIGTVKMDGFVWVTSNRYNDDSRCVTAIRWFFDQIRAGSKLHQVEVWHSGHCGACRRMLTVPSSIQTGLGPVCAERLRS